MSEKLESLLPCPCGNQAELHEWEERDATRWAARATCNCGWEGPIGYADNHRGCFDAVNDLHKQRAIEKWNKRAPSTAANSDSPAWGAITWADLHTALDGAHELSGAPHERINELIRQRDEARVAVIKHAQQAEIDPLSPEGQRLLYERSPSEEVRTNVGSDNLSDQDRKEMDDSLKEWANSPEAAREALLQTIDIKAEAGLCQMTHAGTREFLKDIRAIIKEAANEGAGS